MTILLLIENTTLPVMILLKLLLIVFSVLLFKECQTTGSPFKQPLCFKLRDNTLTIRVVSIPSCTLDTMMTQPNVVLVLISKITTLMIPQSTEDITSCLLTCGSTLNMQMLLLETIYNQLKEQLLSQMQVEALLTRYVMLLPQKFI